MTQAPLIEVRHAKKSFVRGGRRLPVLDDVSLSLMPGEILGVVGVSGCGKSTLLRAIACLERLDEGKVYLQGQDCTCPAQAGRILQMVFQDAQASFDPRWTFDKSLLEALHSAGGNKAQLQELLERVGLPEELLSRRPSELSGGQAQRMAVARALAAGPRALLCDEVTSALDVSAQAQIVRLLAELRERLGLSMIFVSHDLALVAGLCDRVAIMKEGRFIEEGAARDILRAPKEEYTRVLLDSVLTIE